MSHYAVLILHKKNQNLEDILAPYYEGLKVKPYFKYTKEEALIKAKEWIDKKVFARMSDDEKLETMVKEFGYIRDNEDNLFSSYNPDSKWDWWEIGGRFSGNLLANGKQVNSAPVKDVHWIIPLTRKESKEEYGWWQANVEQNKDEKYQSYKEDFLLYNIEYYKRRYKDAATYLKILEQPCFYAVVTPDGAWHEPCQMGWFGVALGEPEQELEWDLKFYNDYIEPYLDSDLIATVIDCHI